MKRNVLSFFRRYSQTAIEASDLAYWVDANEQDLAHALEEMTDLRLI